MADAKGGTERSLCVLTAQHGDGSGIERDRTDGDRRRRGTQYVLLEGERNRVWEVATVYSMPSGTGWEGQHVLRDPGSHHQHRVCQGWGCDLWWQWAEVLGSREAGWAGAELSC